MYTLPAYSNRSRNLKPSEVFKTLEKSDKLVVRAHELVIQRPLNDYPILGSAQSEEKSDGWRIGKRKKSFISLN